MSSCGWVPISHEDEFRRQVEDAGNEVLLVQRAIRAPGHYTNLSDQEQNGTLGNLFEWVERGVKPKGEDLSLPLAEEVGAGLHRFYSRGRPGSQSIPDRKYSLAGA